jgi:hypothetical protein
MILVMVIAVIVQKKNDKNNSLAPGQCAEMTKDQKQKEEVKTKHDMDFYVFW